MEKYLGTPMMTNVEVRSTNAEEALTYTRANGEHVELSLPHYSLPGGNGVCTPVFLASVATAEDNEPSVREYSIEEVKAWKAFFSTPEVSNYLDAFSTVDVSA